MKPSRWSPEEAASIARGDRNKLIGLGLAAVLVLAGLFATRRFGRDASHEARDSLARTAAPADEAIEETVAVPEFSRRDLLAGVRDATAEERARIEPEALDALLEHARGFTRSMHEAAGIRALDAGARAAIEADPGALRAQAFRARGSIERLEREERAGIGTVFRGVLALEDGGVAHFAVLRAADDATLGDFVVLDGFFLKLYRAGGEGSVREGPLFAGAELAPSVPAAPHPAGLDALLATVRDDTLEDLSGEPTAALWELMRVAATPRDAAEWAEAPAIDAELLNRIYHDGTAYRGRPFRFPVSINLDAWVRRPHENPLRADAVTEGWIGNMYWKPPARAAWFVMPGARPELEDPVAARYVVARGYFLKNRAYESRLGTPERVPFFVMEAVEPFTPQPARAPHLFLQVFAAAMGLLVVSIVFALARDRRRTRDVEARRTARRRALREQAPGSGDAREQGGEERE